MKVIVVGAGPVGCATALALHNRGHDVCIHEQRDDPRKNPGEGLRSVNLAMSARGINTLRMISPETAARVSTFFVPMSGRMIHGPDYQKSSAYGLHGESIYSISRFTLNSLLLDEAKLAKIPVVFKSKFQSFDGHSAVFGGAQDATDSIACDLVVGCDGTFSKVRSAMLRRDDFDFSQEYIDHYYLEIPIPAQHDDFAFDPNFLHIWPRHSYMFIALPNANKSMTGTLFAPRKLFKDLDTPEQFLEFFNEKFPDAFKVVGQQALRKYYETYPRGKLLSTKVYPYHLGNSMVLLGDSAHSVVPFYGQGLNCGLEDVTVLMNCLDKAGGNVSTALETYSTTRKPDLDAIYQLSMDNYVEMRSSVTSSAFFFRKWIDRALGLSLKGIWLPLYTMVSFREDIPYSRAISIAKRQNNILNGICLGVTAIAVAVLFRGLAKLAV